MLLLYGRSHVSDTDASPGVAVRPAGAAGCVHAKAAHEFHPAPEAFRARTWKVYSSPARSPVTSCDMATLPMGVQPVQPLSLPLLGR